MIAIEITQPGGPEVLQPCERHVPQPGEGEVLIRVEAAGVARPDLLQRQGKYAPPPGAPDIPGLDVAGIIENANGTSWREGEPVCAILSGGGYAQFAAAPQEQVLPIPDNWTAIEAATLPENLFTVYDNLVIRAGLKKGETVLIHGGTSGIGTTAIMLARMLGCSPFATAGNDEKCAAAQKLGAEAAINYAREDFAEATRKLTDGRGADVVLDMVGGSYLDRNLDSLATEGRIAVIATQGGATGSLDFRKLLVKRARLMGSLMRPRSAKEKGLVRDRLLSEVWPHLPSKKFVRPLVDCTFPLREASRAHERMEMGGHVGKIVLLV